MFNGENDSEIWLFDGVDGSDNVSGKDHNFVSDELFIGSFSKHGSPCR